MTFTLLAIICNVIAAIAAIVAAIYATRTARLLTRHPQPVTLSQDTQWDEHATFYCINGEIFKFQPHHTYKWMQ